MADKDGRYFAERSAAGAWTKAEPPGTGKVTFLTASPAGRLWAIGDGKVFIQLDDKPWELLELPEGLSATTLMPSDEPEAYVLAGEVLVGPASSYAGEELAVDAPATGLCTDPYVRIRDEVQRSKRYDSDVDNAVHAGADRTQVMFGFRGLAGKSYLEAKPTRER